MTEPHPICHVSGEKSYKQSNEQFKLKRVKSCDSKLTSPGKLQLQGRANNLAFFLHSLGTKIFYNILEGTGFINRE